MDVRGPTRVTACPTSSNSVLTADRSELRTGLRAQLLLDARLLPRPPLASRPSAPLSVSTVLKPQPRYGRHTTLLELYVQSIPLLPNFGTSDTLTHCSALRTWTSSLGDSHRLPFSVHTMIGLKKHTRYRYTYTNRRQETSKFDITSQVAWTS